MKPYNSEEGNWRSGWVHDSVQLLFTSAIEFLTKDMDNSKQFLLYNDTYLEVILVFVTHCSVGFVT